MIPVGPQVAPCFHCRKTIGPGAITRSFVAPNWRMQLRMCAACGNNQALVNQILATLGVRL